MTRRRWVYTSGGRPLEAPVEVDLEWRQPDAGPSRRSEAEVYGNLTPATDGTDISSRTKHREYMKANNLTLAEDYTQSWEKARRERESHYLGTSAGERRAIADDVGRALYETRRRGR